MTHCMHLTKASGHLRTGIQEPTGKSRHHCLSITAPRYHLLRNSETQWISTKNRGPMVLWAWQRLVLIGDLSGMLGEQYWTGKKHSRLGESVMREMDSCGVTGMQIHSSAPRSCSATTCLSIIIIVYLSSQLGRQTGWTGERTCEDIKKVADWGDLEKQVGLATVSHRVDLPWKKQVSSLRANPG